MDDDKALLDWLESVRVEIRWRQYLPDNKPTDRPWWVCVEGHVPQVGKTFRQAVAKARSALAAFQEPVTR